VIFDDDNEASRTVELDRLPHLKEVFQALQRGCHISNEDFGLYHELQDNEPAYQNLLAALGYTLVADRRGFYYLIPEDGVQAINATTQKMALIVFVLVDVLADRGRDPAHTLAKGSLDIKEMATAMWERHGELLKEGGLPGAEAVEKYFVTAFRRHGFATVNGDVLRFRAPIHRFLDVCAELGQGRGEASDDHGEPAVAGEASAPTAPLRRLNFPVATPGPAAVDGNPPAPPGDALDEAVDGEEEEGA